MNWIRGKDTAKLIKTCFLEKIIPVSIDLHKKQINFFPLKPNLNSPTYYLERELTAMRPEDFEVPGCENSEALGKSLAELWISQGYKDLIPLAQTTAELAELLRETEEESEEISPFIYIMF